MRIVNLVFICLCALEAQAQTAPAIAFHIRIVNSVTKAPVAGASVALTGDRSDQIVGRTNVEGAFSGTTAFAGDRVLNVAKPGYQMIGGVGTGRSIQLKASPEADVTVEMLPLGVLTGRVLDQHGDPVRHAIVRTQDEVKLAGERQYFQSLSAALTDDRGEYRIGDVEPGKHFVTVEFDSAREATNSRLRSLYRWPKAGGFVLYPDAEKLEQARQVELAAGQTLRLNDIHLVRNPADAKN